MTSNAYIDRNAVIEFHGEMVKTAKKYGRFNDGADDAELWESSVKSDPAADVAPVLHGRWLNNGNFSMCSNCYDLFKERDATVFRFCPNCGARMDQEEIRCPG